MSKAPDTRQSVGSVSQLVNKYNELKKQIAILYTALEKAKQTLGSQEEDLQLLNVNWDISKDELQNTVIVSNADLAASRNETAAVVAHTEALNARIAQRKEKTAQYRAILDAKRAEIENAKATRDNEEAGIRQNLSTFRNCRVELKAELESKKLKIGEAIIKEEEESTLKTKELEKRLRQLELVISAEKKQWEAEQERLDKEDKVLCLAALRSEITAAQQSKIRQINFLKDNSSLKTNIDQATNEIESLLSGLRLAS